MSMDLWYELYGNGHMLERYHEGGEVYVHTAGNIRALLKETGFEVVGWYGGYRKEPFTDNSKMMAIVARPLSKTH
jgi:hypothetical protein